MVAGLGGGRSAADVQMGPGQIFFHKAADKETAGDTDAGTAGTVLHIGHIALDGRRQIRQAGQLPPAFAYPGAAVLDSLRQLVIVTDDGAGLFA